MELAGAVMTAVVEMMTEKQARWLNTDRTVQRIYQSRADLRMLLVKAHTRADSGHGRWIGAGDEGRNRSVFAQLTPGQSMGEGIGTARVDFK
jgi:hypothetical protein